MVEAEAYEVYAHDIFATTVTLRRGVWEEDEVRFFVIAGRDWDGAPFKVYLTQEEASSLLVQLGYQVYERE